MRCMHITSGLLSIVGAAFLFGTVHALIVDPVSVGAVETKDATEPSKTLKSRTEDEPKPGLTTPDPQPEDKGSTDQPVDTTEQTNDLDELLDAPVPDGMLTLRQSHALWEEGAYFVDARKEDEFNSGHIEDAHWLPSTLFDSDSNRAFAVVDDLVMDFTVVIYCVGGDCDASHNTARRLQEIGFSDLRIMGAGYDQWVEAGFPITEGGAP